MVNSIICNSSNVGLLNPFAIHTATFKRGSWSAPLINTGNYIPLELYGVSSLRNKKHRKGKKRK